MQTVEYRINCGSSEAFTDAEGQIWQADRLLPAPADGVSPVPGLGEWYCVGGQSVVREADLPLYPERLAGLLRGECYGMSAYRFSLPDGVYTMRLLLAETFETLTSLNRRFSITLNGVPLADAIQPAAIAGGFARAGELCIHGVRVDGHGLDIGFSEGANVYGIEIVAGSPADRLMLASTALAPFQPQPVAETAVRHRPRMLFVGNSGTFFWAIPETVARMVALHQPTLSLRHDAYYAGGKGVRYFLESPEVRQRLQPGAFDFVVLQDTSEGPIADPDQFRACMPELIELVKSTGAQPILYAYNAPMCYTLAQRRQLQDLYCEVGRRMHVPVVPCAAALAYVLQHDPAQNYHNPDQHHLGMMGGYLMACCWYRALCGASALQHSEHTTLAGHVEIPAEKARYLAEVSDMICTQYGIGTGTDDAILGRYLQV